MEAEVKRDKELQELLRVASTVVAAGQSGSQVLMDCAMKKAEEHGLRAEA